MLPFPRTMSMRDPQSAREEGKRDELRDPQPGCIKQFDETGQSCRTESGGCGLVGPVHARARLCKQSVDLGDREQLRQRANLLRPFDQGGGVVLPVTLGAQKAKKLSRCGKPSSDGCSRQAAAGKPEK